MNKCVFLDRDGVINKDYVDYVHTLERFELLPGVKEGLTALKKAGYLLVVITNQSGIAKGIFTRKDVDIVHEELQKQIGGLIDGFYIAPWHESVSASLTRKPGRLMLEKAIARFQVDAGRSVMLGDKERDLIPAEALGIRGILVNPEIVQDKWSQTEDLFQAAQVLLAEQSPGEIR